MRSLVSLTTSLCLFLLTIGPAAAAENGAQLYTEHCANCHGTYGEGDGAVSGDLPTVLLDLRYLSERNEGDFPREFVRQIIDGRETRADHRPEGMPVWGVELTENTTGESAAQRQVQEQINALVDFLASIQIQ